MAFPLLPFLFEHTNDLAQSIIELIEDQLQSQDMFDWDASKSKTTSNKHRNGKISEWWIQSMGAESNLTFNGIPLDFSLTLFFFEEQVYVEIKLATLNYDQVEKNHFFIKNSSDDPYNYVNKIFSALNQSLYSIEHKITFR